MKGEAVKRALGIVSLLILSLGGAASLAAQAEAFPAGPFGVYVRLSSSPSLNGYFQGGTEAALSPTSGFTFEAWIRERSFPAGEACRSIAGKGYLTTWWIGFCTVGGERRLRSYLRGGGSAFTSGAIPADTWTHIAVTWDGSKRRHYVNFIKVGELDQALAPTTNPANAFRIGSDVNWDFRLDADLDEVRLWSVARNLSQLAQAARYPIRSLQPGLVGVWGFDDPTSGVTFGRDVVGGHDAPLVVAGTSASGSGLAPEVPAPPSSSWLSTSELPGFEFQVKIGASRIGTEVLDCVPETLCVAGALPDRTEVFLRVIGPRPNGLLWNQVSRFTVSALQIWFRQISTGQIDYYSLPGVNTDSDELPGLNDRYGFLP